MRAELKQPELPIEVEITNQNYIEKLAMYEEMIKKHEGVFLVLAKDGKYYCFCSTPRQIEINKLTIIKHN